MAVQLPPVPFWQPKLGALGELVLNLDELAQSIRIIVMTPKGSLCHRPQFGTDLVAFLDGPQPKVTGALVREVTQAIEEFEPRVKVTGVQVDSSTLGASTLSVRWIPRGTAQSPSQVTEVELSGAQGVSGFVPLKSVGIPGGVAPLDTLGTVPPVFLPPVDGAVDGGELL